MTISFHTLKLCPARSGGRTLRGLVPAAWCHLCVYSPAIQHGTSPIGTRMRSWLLWCGEVQRSLSWYAHRYSARDFWGDCGEGLDRLQQTRPRRRELDKNSVIATEQTKRDFIRLAEAIRAAEEKVDRLRRLLSIAECESAKALELYMEANQCRLETIRQNTELERQNAELQAKLDRKKQDMDRFLCSICYKHLVDTTTSCQHVFCRKCVDEWMRVQALEDRNHQFE